MSIAMGNYKDIMQELGDRIRMVAVSKTKSTEAILEMYQLGQRDFGENYVQELLIKQAALPGDIRWHFIGHLQSNKVKQLAAFVHLIQAVDSLKLAEEISKQAQHKGRIIDCLLQVHIAKEESKFGFGGDELTALLKEIPGYKRGGRLAHVRIAGLMGMASFSADQLLLREEFAFLKKLFDRGKSILGDADFSILSMGMSSDYKIAVAEGSTMVRIGSLIFGERQ